MAPHYTFHPDYDLPRDFIGYGENSLNPKWPNDAKIAVSFVINYEEVNSLLLVSFDYRFFRTITDTLFSFFREANAPS